MPKSRLKVLVKFFKPSFIFVPVTLSIGAVCVRGSLSATELSALDMLVASNREIEDEG